LNQRKFWGRFFGYIRDGWEWIKRGHWWKRWIDFLKPALKSADVILGSLAKALPLMHSIEILKEFKEGAETLLDISEKSLKRTDIPPPPPQGTSTSVPHP
jgi:hypothetical protein